MISTAYRVLLAVLYPFLTLFLYLRELDGNYGAGRLVLASAIALVLAIGIFLYPPIAKRVEPRSVAWYLGLAVSVMLVVHGMVASIDPANTWGFPVTFFACWIPAIHVACKSLDKLDEGWSFFKAPRKS